MVLSVYCEQPIVQLYFEQQLLHGNEISELDWSLVATLQQQPSTVVTYT